MRAGVPLFILIGSYPHAELAQNFVQSLGRVLEFLEETNPFIATVAKRSQRDFLAGRAGRVRLHLSYEEWKKIVID